MSKMTSPAYNDGFYKSLFDNNHSMMLIIQPKNGNIVDANIAACKYYGYSKADMTSMTIMDINTLSCEQVYEEMRNAKLENCNRFNFRHRLANGEEKDVEVFSGPIIYKDEKLLYSIIHDISERKFAEDQVEKEKKFSESLIRSLPGIMYLFDEFGRPQRWNKNLEEVTGFFPEEIKNMTPLDFIAPEDEKVVQKAIKEVFHQGSADIEAGLLTKDGQIIPYFFTGVRLINNGLKYLVGVGLDVTEKNKAEKEKENLIKKLQETLSQVKQLTGLLPICASCKKIRDDKGYWKQIEIYIRDHSEADFSHGICPDCEKKLYSKFYEKD